MQITGSCSKGISIDNVKKANIKNINVSGYSGPLINVYNVTGKGVENAAAIDPPRIPEPIPDTGQSYQLR